MESSRPLRAASDPDEAPTAVHETTPIHPVTEPESLAPALASSDQCASCGSQLAPDQHYCLVCGERRGAARFSAIPTPPAVAATLAQTRAGARSPRFGSAATTLIAGVATLLIAMGIGLYIGTARNVGNNGGVRVITVNGGSAAAAGPTPTTAAAAAGGSGSGAGAKPSRKSGGSHKGSTAAKVVTTVKNQPPPTVTVGASGSGKGFQKGKFTGHFFGP